MEVKSQSNQLGHIKTVFENKKNSGPELIEIPGQKQQVSQKSTNKTNSVKNSIHSWDKSLEVETSKTTIKKDDFNFLTFFKLELIIEKSNEAFIKIEYGDQVHEKSINYLTLVLNPQLYSTLIDCYSTEEIIPIFAQSIKDDKFEFKEVSNGLELIWWIDEYDEFSWHPTENYTLPLNQCFF